MAKDFGRSAVFLFNKKGKFLIHSVSTVQMGAGIATEPFIWCNVGSSEEMAQKLLYALESSQTDLPTPLDWKVSEREFIASIGLKSPKELNNNTINVSVTKQDGKITFTPMINLGPRKGSVNANTDPIIIPANSSLTEISAALQKAFEKCE